jgi:hypothetical protein
VTEADQATSDLISRARAGNGDASLRVFEAGLPGFTQQANGAPSPGGVGEHDARFVVESFRSDELAMADALVEVTLSRVVKPGGGRVTLRRRHHNRQGQ